MRSPTRLTRAGTVFVGEYSAQASGDYATGSNHVLPTNGAARARGGLSAADFVRVATVQRRDAPRAAAASAPRRVGAGHGRRAAGARRVGGDPARRGRRSERRPRRNAMSYEYERVATPASGLRLHLNENTAGCSPAVIEASRSLTPRQLAEYPDYDAAVQRDRARGSASPWTQCC